MINEESEYASEEDTDAAAAQQVSLFGEFFTQAERNYDEPPQLQYQLPNMGPLDCEPLVKLVCHEYQTMLHSSEDSADLIFEAISS